MSGKTFETETANGLGKQIARSDDVSLHFHRRIDRPAIMESVKKRSQGRGLALHNSNLDFSGATAETVKVCWRELARNRIYGTTGQRSEKALA